MVPGLVPVVVVSGLEVVKSPPFPVQPWQRATTGSSLSKASKKCNFYRNVLCVIKVNCKSMNMLYGA